MALAVAGVTFTPNTEKWIKEQIGAENFEKFKIHIQRSGGIGKKAAVAVVAGLEPIQGKFYYIARQLQRNDRDQLYISPEKITAYREEYAAYQQYAERTKAAGEVPVPKRTPRETQLETTTFRVSNPTNPLTTYTVQVRGRVTREEVEGHIRERDVRWFDKNVRAVTVMYGATFGGEGKEQKIGAAQGVARIFGEHGEKKAMLINEPVKYGLVFKKSS